MKSKSRTQSFLIITAALIFAYVIGTFVGSRLTSRQDVEAMHAVELSHSALKTSEMVMLLKAPREANNDGAIERLATYLDFAIISLARDYTPDRDVYGGAAKSLDLAREYRATHPRTTALSSVDRQVQVPFASNVQSPPPR